MREFARDGVHLAYDDEGTGSAVLFSHCWLFDGRQFPQTAAVARAGYRVLNLDNRGHGRSGPYRGPHTMWDVGDDLARVLDDAGEEQAVLVGLSIGGYAGLRAALRHPERFRALVIAAASAGLMTRYHRAVLHALLPLLLTPARSLVTPPMITNLFGPTARRTRPELIDEWRRRWRELIDRDPISVLATGRAALFRQEDLSPELGRITQPTLVIAGEEDAYMPAAAALAAHLPRARLVVLPDAGHSSSLEAPALFEAALLEFLRDLDGKQTSAKPISAPAATGTR